MLSVLLLCIIAHATQEKLRQEMMRRAQLQAGDAADELARLRAELARLMAERKRLEDWLAQQRALALKLAREKLAALQACSVARTGARPPSRPTHKQMGAV